MTPVAACVRPDVQMAGLVSPARAHLKPEETAEVRSPRSVIASLECVGSVQTTSSTLRTVPPTVSSAAGAKSRINSGATRGLLSATDTFTPLRIAIVTVSDTRTLETDTSGALLASRASEAGHHVLSRQLVKDDVDALHDLLSGLVAEPSVQVILTTGGTGITARDITPEVITGLVDKQIDGFGELFRMISFDEIGTSTIQSRACAGVAAQTLVFALPGSTGACRTAWDRILAAQLDSRHRPCNFATLLERL